MNLGFQELILILIIVLVLFGSSRIPQLMGGLGEGLKNFKKAMRDDGDKDSTTPNQK
ncbi:MAG: twin-arginine translocase TatA/TatE family subunit [Acidobacteria bacterium]|nr:twin-arginine translocase TatA/TatE family subunit [Acidobacteriota bacterium]